MIVLGFDTATSASAVALRLSGRDTRERRDDPAPGEHPGHATRLLEMAAQLLSEAGTAWSELDRLAVGVGPGAFTGLRVGVATARGLAQSLSLELVGVSSLAALAEAALAPGVESARPDPAIAGRAPAGRPADSVVAVIDARRGEAFAAAYEAGGGPDPIELSPPRALPPEDLAPLFAEAGRGGDGRRRRLAVGDGAVRFRDWLQDAGLAVPETDSPLHRVSAGVVCAAAARAIRAPSYLSIVPDYKRRPDAELALEGVGGERRSRG